jgi:hypothetical protein
MGVQAIEAAPRDGSPVFLVDKDTGDMTATHWAVVQRLFQTEGTSIAYSPTHWLPGFKTVRGSYGTSRVVVRASVTVGACVLWLFIGAVGDNGLCGESNTRAQAFVAPTEDGRKISQLNAIRDESSLVSRVVETTVVEQKQILERSHEKNDILADRLTPIQGSDAAQGNAAQAPQSVPAWERTQALQHAEALARALTSSLRAELDALRSAAEAARIKQRQALDQERERVDALARELTSLRAELDAARTVGPEVAQAPAAEAEQKQALEQELKLGRDRAETLARELTSLRAELDAARIAGSQAVQSSEAEIKQKQVVEQELKQERDRADTLARELTSLRAELDAARVAGSQAVQAADAESKQKQAVEQELKQKQGRADTLARELTSLHAELDAARTGGSEAVQAAEAESKQKQAVEQALKQERDRADTLARELASLRVELDRARTAGPEVVQVAAAEVAQKQGLDEERDRAEALGRELTSLRAELDTARAQGGEALRTAEAAKIEQELALRKERDKTETLTLELASVQKKAEEQSARLAAAYAEVLWTTETNSAIAAEQKRAAASERDRADALARELASARNGLDAGNWHAAALNAFRALHMRESPVDSSQERIVAAFSMTEGKGRATEQISGEAVASTSGRSSASELPGPVAASTAREAPSDLDPKVAMATERSASLTAASYSLVDEQRLLARANALLRQADISGARALLAHALERGSARAAFMLAETYDARVLQSWRARGISGDLPKARELYERAQAGGIEDAKARIEALK